MTALTGRTIKSTYTDLLQVSNGGDGVDGTLRNVSDGEGTNSALQLSSTEAKVQGDLTVTNDLTVNTLTFSGGSGFLQVNNDLSDVASASTSRTNLGLGTMATQAATAVDIDGGTIDGATIGGTSAGAVTATTLTATDVSVISVSSSSDALRITQTGAGNALVVEDSTNPDSTPVVVDASGNVGIGTSSPDFLLDVAGRIGILEGTNGIAFHDGAGSVSAGVRADSGDNLVFATGSSDTERGRIDSSGRVGIGRTPTTNLLEVAGTIESTSGGFKFPDGSTQSSAGASTGKAIAMAIVFGG